MLLDVAYDPNNVPQSKFEVLPPGWYPMIASQSEICVTKAGDGHYLKITWELQDGSNRKLWQNIVYDSKNQVARKIAEETIQQICKAVGYTESLNQIDTNIILGKIVEGKVVVKKDDYGEKNEIKAVKPYSVAQATSVVAHKVQPASPQQAAPRSITRPNIAPAAGAVARPWNKPQQNGDDHIPF